MMEIYDCITFKIISKFELPITPAKYEIIDNNYILIYEKHKLYCYSINLSENKLIFIFGVNDVNKFKRTNYVLRRRKTRNIFSN